MAPVMAVEAAGEQAAVRYCPFYDLTELSGLVDHRATHGRS
jgi:hypothetical protein